MNLNFKKYKLVNVGKKFLHTTSELLENEINPFDSANKGGENILERTFEAKVENLHEVLEFVEGELEQHDCNMKTSMMISVMVEEIFVNIASYAYEGKTGTAIVDMEFDDDSVNFRFIDSGMEFNPLAKEDPDITASAEDRPVGGLGIFMVKNYMDEISYERKNNQNILSFRKVIK